MKIVSGAGLLKHFESRWDTSSTGQQKQMICSIKSLDFDVKRDHFVGNRWLYGSNERTCLLATFHLCTMTSPIYWPPLHCSVNLLIEQSCISIISWLKSLLECQFMPNFLTLVHPECKTKVTFLVRTWMSALALCTEKDVKIILNGIPTMHTAACDKDFTRQMKNKRISSF